MYLNNANKLKADAFFAGGVDVMMILLVVF